MTCTLNYGKTASFDGFFHLLCHVKRCIRIFASPDKECFVLDLRKTVLKVKVYDLYKCCTHNARQCLIVGTSCVFLLFAYPEKLIKESYALLGLISFLTAGEPEVRAWTIKKGTLAPQAAGKIHSDIERGFIRAEIVSYEDLMSCGSMTAAKEKGLVRSEGKEYVMKDGDVTLFRFNV